MYRIVEHIDSRLHPTLTFRIVDHEGTMIAKVNGPRNVDACQKMIDALEQCEQMKSLLRNRLMDILKQIKGSGLTQIAVRDWLREGKDPVYLVEQLKEQVAASPVRMASMFGGEAVQILQVL